MNTQAVKSSRSSASGFDCARPPSGVFEAASTLIDGLDIRPSLSGYLEDPQRGAAVGRILDFRHQRWKRRCLCAAVAGDERDVLTAVDDVRDRRRARHIVQ